MNWLKGLVWILIFGYWVWVGARDGFCQTVCVRSPIIQFQTKQEREPLRLQVESWVREQGFQTGCERAQLELVVEPLEGVGESGREYFTVQAADGVGTVDVRPEAYAFRTWQVTLFPMGGMRSLRTRLGPGLRGNVRGVLRWKGLAKILGKTYN